MKKRFLALAWGLSSVGLCFGGGTSQGEILITEINQVPMHVGKTVALVGVVSRKKVPMIHGVDVYAAPDFGGKRARAVGILERYEVTKADIEKMDRLGVAHRPPGVFYRLIDPTTKMVSEVSVVE